MRGKRFLLGAKVQKNAAAEKIIAPTQRLLMFFYLVSSKEPGSFRMISTHWSIFAASKCGKPEM